MEDTLSSTDPLIEINESYVRSAVDHLNSANFGQVQAYIRNTVGGRSLTQQEKGCIESVVRSVRMKQAEELREQDSLFTINEEMPPNILMVTAYSNDYTIGHVCERVNRIYAQTHGYEFYSEVLSLEDMAREISPKKHCTWYKIVLLRKLFANIELLKSKNIQYIMWIDADAIVVDHKLTLFNIINISKQRDLIIAEDMNPGCLINAGVFLLRATTWSRDFLLDVWNIDKYDEVCFYEQSAIIRSLRLKKEGLESMKPFHSYLTTNTGSSSNNNNIKIFPHTTVLSIFQFNSNRGILCNDTLMFQKYAQQVWGSHLNTPKSENTIETTTCTDNITTAATADTVGTAVVSTVACICYATNGNYCSLCQRTVGNSHRRRDRYTTTSTSSSSTSSNSNISNSSSSSNTGSSEADIIAQNSKLFIFHPAGMPDKLLLLHAAIYKYRIPYDLVTDILLNQSEYDKNSNSSSTTTILQEGNIEAPGRVAAGVHAPGGVAAGVYAPGGVAAGVCAPLRLIRGKLGQIPQADQPHLFNRVGVQK